MMRWIYFFLLLLVFQSQPHQLLVTTDPDTVYLIDITTGGDQRLGAGYLPTWSPDGEWLFWTTNVNAADSHHRELWLADHTGANPQMIVTSEDALRAFWSPDSQQIAWLIGVDGRAEFGFFDIRDASIHLLHTAQRRIVLHWSPDSHFLAWAEETPAVNGVSDLSLHLIGRQGDNAREILTLPKYGQINWSWSQDSAHLLLEADNRFAPDGVPATEIYIIDITTGAIFTEPLGRQATWSPTGAVLAWLRRNEANTSDLVVRSVTGNTQQFSLDLNWETELQWSPNGALLAVITNSSVLYIIDVESGANITRMNAQQASWTPDGRLVYRSPVNDLLDWYILDRPGTDHPAQFWLQTPMTSNPALFSPDDSRMALALDTFSNTGSYRIGVAALAQSGSLQLYTVEDRPGRVLQLHGWSGEYVLYSTRSSQSGVGDYEYGVLDTHTGTMTRITVADGRTVHDAAWRP